MQLVEFYSLSGMRLVFSIEKQVFVRQEFLKEFQNDYSFSPFVRSKRESWWDLYLEILVVFLDVKPMKDWGPWRWSILSVTLINCKVLHYTLFVDVSKRMFKIRLAYKSVDSVDCPSKQIFFGGCNSFISYIQTPHSQTSCVLHGEQQHKPPHFEAPTHGPIPLKGAETKVQHLSGHHKAVHMAS